MDLLSCVTMPLIRGRGRSWTIVMTIFLLPLFLGFSGAVTTESPESNTSQSVLDDGDERQSLQTEFPKSVIALCCLGGCVLIGVVVAKILDRVHDRLSLRDDVSDMSDHTRELLKARFAMSFTSLARQEEVRDQRERDMLRASKFGRLWIAHAAMSRKKRKDQHNLTSILNEKNSQIQQAGDKSSPRLVSFKPKEETITEMKEDDASSKDADVDVESGQVKNVKQAPSELRVKELYERTVNPGGTHSQKSVETVEAVSTDKENKTPNGNINKAEYTLENETGALPKAEQNGDTFGKETKTVAQARRHFEFRDEESDFAAIGDSVSPEGMRPTTAMPHENHTKEFSSDEDEFPSLEREGTTATINLAAYESKAADKPMAKPKTADSPRISTQPQRTNAWASARPVSSRSLRKGDKPGARPLTAGTSKRITPGARKSSKGAKK